MQQEKRGGRVSDNVKEIYIPDLYEKDLLLWEIYKEVQSTIDTWEAAGSHSGTIYLKIDISKSQDEFGDLAKQILRLSPEQKEYVKAMLKTLPKTERS